MNASPTNSPDESTPTHEAEMSAFNADVQDALAPAAWSETARQAALHAVLAEQKRLGIDAQRETHAENTSLTDPVAGRIVPSNVGGWWRPAFAAAALVGLATVVAWTTLDPASPGTAGDTTVVADHDHPTDRLTDELTAWSLAARSSDFSFEPDVNVEAEAFASSFEFEADVASEADVLDRDALLQELERFARGEFTF